MRQTLLLTLLFLLFSGCSQTRVTKRVEPAPVEAALPAWYTGPLREKGGYLYGKGSSDTEEKATEAALADLRERVYGEVLGTFEENLKRLGRYLTKREIASIRKNLSHLKITGYEVTKRACLSDGRCLAMVRVSRADLAAPYKKRIIRRLVPIEEGWHGVQRRDILTRYRTAKTAHRKMVALLPDYIFAASIDPFGENVRKRVENGIPYFARMERSLKDRLSFCLEPAETPALELFSEAVETRLKSGHYPIVAWDEAGKDTICIRVEGVFDHDNDAETHRLRASIDLKLREPYRQVIEKRHYVVNGASSQSGIEALHQAKRALEKRLSRDFPFSE
jgi:hypothetical protein